MLKLSCLLMIALAASFLPARSSAPYASEESRFFESIDEAQAAGQISQRDAQKYRQQLASLRAQEKLLLQARKLDEREKASLKDELSRMQSRLKSQIADSVVEPNSNLEALIERKISAGQSQGHIDFNTAGQLINQLNLIKVAESKLISDGNFNKSEKLKIGKQLRSLQAKLTW